LAFCFAGTVLRMSDDEPVFEFDTARLTEEF
jgi:hypothetical protein